MTRAWSVVAIVIVAACRSSRTPVAPLSRRDSAGIAIVETNVPAWGNLARWNVDTTPSLSIGQADGAAPYMFAQIAGAIRRGDGSVVVADGATRELRAFDSAGHFMMARGRGGQGPAEFRGIERIARCGKGELWVDARARRISVWTINLEYLREFVVPDNIMWPLICFGGTGLLVQRSIGNDVNHPPNTIYFDSLHLMVTDSVGASRRDFMAISLWPYIDVPSKRIGFPHPFGRSTLLAGDGPNLVIGFGERLQVNTYSKDGRLLRIARGPVEDLVLTAAMRRDYQAVRLAGEEKEKRDGLQAAGNPMPKSIPAYAALSVDAEGNTWVNRFELPGHARNRWGVFARDGQFLGHLSLPAGLEVLEIGADYVLGKTTDSVSGEQVRLYRLHK
jgi:hypothetical protein